MAVSDQLNKVSARARQAEARTSNASEKAAAELRDEVELARQISQENSERLRQRAEAQRDVIGSWWRYTQEAWVRHLAASHQADDRSKRIIDLRIAERSAQDAERKAAFAIEYACAAIEEAEYAVLDAALARAEADEMARPRSLR